MGGITTSRLNMILTDGMRLAATSLGHSLFVLDGDGRVVVASEPFDDDPGGGRCQRGRWWRRGRSG